jgi:CDP-diacylglycerol--glycerol-3-phosphate 3-phosphatidyltransferase
MITLFRIFLLIVVFACLSLDGLRGHTAAFILTILLIALDGVDGMVARHLHQESEFGSVFDIVVDRIVESCFWIFFAARGVIPAWFPMIIVSRGFLTDAMRSVALSRGMTAFGSKSLHKSKVGELLVTSRFSRGLYGVVKVASFLFLILIDGMNLNIIRGFLGEEHRQVVMDAGYVMIYFTLLLCLVRGLPVLAESRKFLRPRPAQ